LYDINEVKFNIYFREGLVWK